MKATLKDIAARVGVTSQLVSFYLNHPETTRVARETREKIDAAVKELNYRPNSVARALCTGKTGTIGLIMGGLTERKRGCYIHSLMNEAKRYGYHLLTAITNYNQREEQEILEYMLGRQVDGILYTLQLAPGNRISQRLHESRFPILMHARRRRRISAPSVTTAAIRWLPRWTLCWPGAAGRSPGWGLFTMKRRRFCGSWPRKSRSV